MDNIESIIIENEKRRAILNSPYDPIVGIGSPLERKELVIDDLGVFYLPVSFFDSDFGNVLERSGSIGKFMENVPGIKNFEDGLNEFNIQRIKYDFEFWCAYAINIQDGKTLEEFKFRLRVPQRKVLFDLMEMFSSGVPIAMIIVKARQWGGSTLVEFFMMWIQQVHEKNWHMAICGQDDGAASNVREMVMRAAEKYPSELGNITFKPYARSSKNIINVQRGGIIGVGSINNPGQFRSYNYAMLHSTELCEWEETQKRSAKQLVTALRSVLKGQPHSVDIMESTAKGVGNFFHKEWQDAVNGKSKYKPIFVGHHEIENYQTDITGSPREFIESFRDYDKFLWRIGSTLENINWYQNTMQEKNYDEWQMKQEYPSTADEAFQSSGQRVFAPKYVIRIRETCKDPEFIGSLFSDSEKGEKALQNIIFNSHKGGNLSVWTMPELFVEIEGQKYLVKDRYCGFADIGGRTEKADFSELTIMDRLMMCPEVNGGTLGLPEKVAQWHGHLDQDLFAWECAKIGWWYNKMLLAIETNSLKTMETEGNHFFTVLDEISPFYPNLYVRNSPDSIKQDFIPKYGFQTNVLSKGMIIDSHNGLLREQGYVERDIRACDQMDYYETKKNGTQGAVEGEKDDMVITTAGSGWLATKFMPLPKLIKLHPEGQKRKHGKSTISEASF